MSSRTKTDSPPISFKRDVGFDNEKFSSFQWPPYLNLELLNLYNIYFNPEDYYQLEFLEANEDVDFLDDWEPDMEIKGLLNQNISDMDRNSHPNLL